MQVFRRIALVYLYPVVEFSFTEKGKVYKLTKRVVSQRADRYTLTFKDVQNGAIKKRHFTFDTLRKTFVYLRDDLKTSKQPKTNICITVSCI